MDGGGRLLQSISGLALSGLGGRLLPTLAAPAPAAFALVGSHAFPVAPQAVPRLPRWRRRRRFLVRSLAERMAHSRVLGSCLVVALLGGSIGYGAVRGGLYDTFVADNGTVSDALARTAGFSIRAVTITGLRDLKENEILRLAGIGPNSSLLFLNAATIRARLQAVPLIKEASVTKLYPGRLLFEIEERQPYALWQKDGNVSVVAADGTTLSDLHDARYAKLPLVVGEGANGKLPEYLGILEAAGDLRERVRAGIYVSGRRWSLKMDNGVLVDLPETDPATAVSRFALLEHDGHILEKDIISADLRLPDRVVARLAADAAATRAAALAAKTKKKGAAT